MRCWATISWRLYASRSAIALLRSSFASSVSPNQPKRSRTGLSRRLAPSWIGERTLSAPRCTECRRPAVDSPDEAASRISEAATSTTSTARRRLTALSCICVSTLAPWTTVAMVGAVGLMDGLELLEAAAAADRDAGQRRLGAVGGHLGLLAQALVEALQQAAAAGEHDPAVHDVRRELGRRAVERLLDRVDDLHQRLLERGTHLLGSEDHGLREPGDEVAAADLGLDLLLERVRAADLELDLLGRLLADQEFVLLLDVVDDRVVELVAADADALADDDAAEADDGHLGGAAADVDDHVARGLADG